MIFVTTVICLMIVWYVISSGTLYTTVILPQYLILLAKIVTPILNIFGYQAISSGSSVLSRDFSIDIAAGCDAVEPMLLFSIVMLAYPAKWQEKLIGIFAGVLILFTINIVRLVSLFWIGVHYKDSFEVIHMEVWQPLFIFCTLAVFGTWMFIVGSTQRTKVAGE
ncbi:MAG: archaeosortase/exosortase family protein [Candidatus Kapaibacterium sp.]|nr:archaeosortase/exosortase family protein [Bacteroidota bacterium]